jgi:hypothetical protein
MGYIFPPPEGVNSLKSSTMFKQRLLYKQKSFSRLFDLTPLDTLYEKPFYGKVDIHGIPVYPSEADMVQIAGSGLNLVLDFVAAAFNDFKSFMDKALVSNNRVFNDLFSSFVPRSATKNIHQAYNDHFIENVFEVFANGYMNIPKINRRVRTFEDFMQEFLHFAREVVTEFPITKTAFILSPFCPNTISGLFIELDTLPCDNDTLKYERFLSRPSFSRYLKAASGYGFYVDKNVPWRIAANLDSPAMTGGSYKEGHPEPHTSTIDDKPVGWHSDAGQGYMARYGVDIADNSVFSSHYYESEYFSYESIKARLWNLYTTLLMDPGSKTYGTVYTTKNCTNAIWRSVADNRYSTKMSDGFREPIPAYFDKEAFVKAQEDGFVAKGESAPITFVEKYTDDYFLPFYLRLRLIESQISYKPRDFTSAIEKIFNYRDAYSIQAAVAHLGALVNKTKIYKKPISDHVPPYKIKYFGDSISSGLYSYLGSDILKKSEIKKYTNTEY